MEIEKNAPVEQQIKETRILLLARVEVPTSPGLGIEVDETVLSKFTIGSVTVVDKPSDGQRVF